MNNDKLAKCLLRFGLAFVLVYAAFEVYNNPTNFLKYVPKIILDIVPIDLFLVGFGIIEIILAAWLLSGWKGQIPSMLSFFMMAGIIAFNMEHFHILFRNVAIGFGCLALVALETNNGEKTTESKGIGSRELQTR